MLPHQLSESEDVSIQGPSAAKQLKQLLFVTMYGHSCQLAKHKGRMYQREILKMLSQHASIIPSTSILQSDLRHTVTYGNCFIMWNMSPQYDGETYKAVHLAFWQNITRGSRYESKSRDGGDEWRVVHLAACGITDESYSKLVTILY